jgi:hypothetical protein
MKNFIDFVKKFYYLPHPNSHPMDINGELIRRVWEKASTIPGQDPETYRTDMSGTWIRLKDFNDEDSVYGWTIYSVSGADHNLANLMQLIPLHTFNNASISGILPGTSTRILEEPLF